MRYIILLAALWLIAPASAKTKHTAHGTWQLVWHDEFSSRRLSDAWTRIPRSSQPPEWNKYMTSDDRLYHQRRGKLTLYGLVNDFLPNDTAPYLTGGIYTKDRQTFQRGRIEVCLRMDNAQGAWPAVWLLPQEGAWPEGGEIDIMERLNGDDVAHQTVHSPFTLYDQTVKKKPRSTCKSPIRNGRYNVYGVELYEDSLCFFINDTYTFTYRRQPEYGPAQFPYDRPMYLLIDMQLGGKWVGPIDPTQLPYRYQIDYVRFYKSVQR